MTWRPTVAFMRAAVAAVVLIAIAVVWRRPDLLVLAAPMAVVTVWSLLTKPTGDLSIEEGLTHPTIREGDATRWRGTLSGNEHLDLVVASMGDAPWFDRRPASGVAVSQATNGRATVEVEVRSTRWGVRRLEPVWVTATTPFGAFRWSTTTARHPLTTHPVPTVFDTDAWARPSDGLIGLHRSARPGEGNEFAGIRSFRMGDRMRRINWVRSQRAGELQVNATFADLDTHVALVIDASDDFGVSEGFEGLSSSLDASVRAAGAIAEHYAPRGERVSLRTFGSERPHIVPPATGRAQVRRILDTLAGVRPSSEWRTGVPAHDPRGVVGQQLTVMLSPLIAPDALDSAVSLGRHGVPVIVIDTLPDHITADEDAYTALAWRIRLLERRQELRMVQAAGIPVVRWRGPGSLDQVIRDISRRAAGPRAVVR
ncbi:DUF58 domain-containing protein [Ilumatobacter nonamiensis]|uniref:DUF58 domain-containing protein n=1 Tax=Ilumatobacter nonamiensis TaxID=467093 RepID=UPI00034A6860|nr:DUF58 domain-containing protein [Ilumatobacter nonamiensis]